MAIDVEQFYRRYGPMVLRRCRHLLRNEDDAVEAAQDVFVQLIRRQDQLRDEAPSSLLYRIATNVCLNAIRSRGRRPESADQDLVSRIALSDDPLARNESRSLLARLFGNEKESTRVIAVMHLFDGMTLEEVAREVRMSVSGVRKRLRALRTNLVELNATP